MVVNAPQSNIVSAAEHTIALLLAQARNIPQADAALRAGRWERERFQGVELHGKTLGVDRARPRGRHGGPARGGVRHARGGVRPVRVAGTRQAARASS